MTGRELHCTKSPRNLVLTKGRRTRRLGKEIFRLTRRLVLLPVVHMEFYRLFYSVGTETVYKHRRNRLRYTKIPVRRLQSDGESVKEVHIVQPSILFFNFKATPSSEEQKTNFSVFVKIFYPDGHITATTFKRCRSTNFSTTASCDARNWEEAVLLRGVL